VRANVGGKNYVRNKSVGQNLTRKETRRSEGPRGELLSSAGKKKVLNFLKESVEGRANDLVSRSWSDSRAANNAVAAVSNCSDVSRRVDSQKADIDKWVDTWSKNRSEEGGLFRRCATGGEN